MRAESAATECATGAPGSAALLVLQLLKARPEFGVLGAEAGDLALGAPTPPAMVHGTELLQHMFAGAQFALDAVNLESRRDHRFLGLSGPVAYLGQVLR